MYLLDTNIVSLFEPRRIARSAGLVDWMRRNDARIRLSAMTVAEVEAGILKLIRDGKPDRAAQLAAFRDGLLTDFADRILPMDAAVALAVARLAEKARPTVPELADLIIAATASVHGLTILTRNLRHFAPTGIPALDPEESLPG
ncbi:type II toxin-antitoxin system VapC family toxin [Prosthecomicrobium sp. N25]|uniref:type II toxin-antitoxin system VapC family toxin n=1 Tax=Prosthecomicrobium sp. N25 TaxID=3129254 RepID=UPI00307774FC